MNSVIAQPQVHHVSAADGTRIGYTQNGEGRVTVLLHGLQRTGRVWDDMVPALLPGRSIIRPDLRGRGHSDIPRSAAAYDLEHLVDDLQAVLADTGAGPVDLIAWSMGCSVAWAFSHRPAAVRIARWVFISGSPSPAGTRGWFQANDLAGAKAEAHDRAQRKGMMDTAAPFAAAAAWMSVRQADFLSNLPNIQVPSLFIHGDMDEECPLGSAVELAGRVPGARLEVLTGVGHNPMAERQVRVEGLIGEFLGMGVARGGNWPTRRLDAAGISKSNCPHTHKFE